MPKTYSKELRDKAYFLRADNGLLHNDIATRLNVPLVTVKRWLKGVKPNTSPDRTNPKTKVIEGGKENIGIIKESENIGGTEGLKELKNICDTEKLNNNSFHDMKVTFSPDGGISLESDSKPFMPEPSKDVEHTPLNPKVKPETEVAGGGQQYQTSHMTEHRHIDEPENVMDKFFSRGLVETLVPVGLLLAGFMLKGKKGEKGEFREERGDNW